MKISTSDTSDLLDYWHHEKTHLRAEIIGGHVSFWFTGTVARYSTVELVLARDFDELSISLFSGTFNVFEPSSKKPPVDGWSSFKRVVQIATDGGAQCTIYELEA